MIYMSSTIGVSSGSKREPAENGDADQIIKFAIRKEKAMGALVMQDKHPVLHEAH